MTMQAVNLTPEEIVALSNMFDKTRDYVKAARDAVKPGKVDIRASIQLAGSLRIGEESEVIPTYKIPLITTLALMAQRMGVTRDSTLKLIAEVVSEAFSNRESPDEALLALIKDAEKEIERIRKELVTKLPKESRKGQARFSGIAERREPDRTFARVALS